MPDNHQDFDKNTSESGWSAHLVQRNTRCPERIATFLTVAEPRALSKKSQIILKNTFFRNLLCSLMRPFGAL